jgi:hypothetical protein
MKKAALCMIRLLMVMTPLLFLTLIGQAILVSGTVFGDESANGPKSLGDLSGPWQLFIDDSAIAEKSNLKRTYHPFKKYAANPVLVADQPWEGDIAYVYGSILPTEDGTGYRVWYHAYHDSEKAYRNLYATSRDGIKWEKPSLGLAEHKGSRKNNLLPCRTHEEHLPQVIHTPWEKDPAKRYKQIVYEYGRTPPHYNVSGFYGAYSPDGIHWTNASNPPTPVLKDPGDVGNFVWDPHADRYLGYPKKFTEVRGFRRRCVGVSATEDFKQWPKSRLIMVPDEIDDHWVTGDVAHTDFYGLSGFAYESGYVGFLWIFRITDGKNDGPIWCELVSSRDGVNWIRQEPQNNSRLPILVLGRDGTWDDAMVFTPNHPLVEGDTIKLFYGGFDTTHGSITSNGAIGLATLRKDGFASLDAGKQPGQLTTKPLENASGQLRLNCDASDGYIRVEVLDQAGNAIKGYSLEDCSPVRANGVDLAVSWGQHDRLPVTASPLRLRFVLTNASLYSFAAGDGVKLVEADKKFKN